MLGWFKKKLKRKEKPPVTVEPKALVDLEDQKISEKPKKVPVEIDSANKEDIPRSASKIDVLTEKDVVAASEPQIDPPTKDQKSTDPASGHDTSPEEIDPPESPIPTPDTGSTFKVVKESDVVQKKEKKKNLFSRLTERLGKTRESFTYQLDALFLGKKEIDAQLIDDLEEILITADLGVNTSQELIDYTRRKVKRKELADPESLKAALKEKIKSFIIANEQDATLVMPDKGPFVIMVIGVNGVGKTTTIGKIAHKFKQTNNSVMLVAADTFRAAAVSQLKIWGERNKVPVVAHQDGADPSSVVFDALSLAQTEKVDVVIVDTAGRMHTKDNLMEELKKIKRVISKKLPGAPHEIMLVIDATTGQNGISQARLFDDAVGVTGMTLSKLDGTSKGGIVANICKELQIPIRFIGIGEQMDDLRDFDANEFVDALFHNSSNIGQ